MLLCVYVIRRFQLEEREREIDTERKRLIEREINTQRERERD